MTLKDRNVSLQGKGQSFFPPLNKKENVFFGGEGAKDMFLSNHVERLRFSKPGYPH